MIENDFHKIHAEIQAEKQIQQKKEIESIKERKLIIELSDADVERISIQAGMHGLSVKELIEAFIGDLIGGTYSNGSDERDYANQWFERCWFGMYPEKTLLWYLLGFGHDINDFLTAYDEMKYFETNQEEFSDEIAELEDGEQLWFHEEYHMYVDHYLEDHKDIDIEKEVTACRKWLIEFNELKG